MPRIREFIGSIPAGSWDFFPSIPSNVSLKSSLAEVQLFPLNMNASYAGWGETTSRESIVFAMTGD